jgi:ABC-2 type transport system ATP-binding protein
MWEIIRRLVADGVTVFLTTQYLEEADRLADRIALLDNGRIVAEGTAAELKRRVAGGHIRLRFNDPGSLAAAVRHLGIAARDDAALVVQVPSDGSMRSLRTLLDDLDRQAIQVEELSVHTPDLDDVFMALTGSDARQEDPR